MKAVYIEWEDHCQVLPDGGGAWIEADLLSNKPAVIKSVGFVLKEDEHYLTIGSCQDADEDAFKGVSVIIKSCIVIRKDITWN
jgi:hypothetical protein